MRDTPLNEREDDMCYRTALIVHSRIINLYNDDVPLDEDEISVFMDRIQMYVTDLNDKK